MVHFTYALPLSDDTVDFPNTEMFQHMLQDMYESFLFPEYKSVELHTMKDDIMMTDEEKDERMKKVKEIYDRLTSPSAEEDEAI